jgi:hypothetical protein
MIIFNGIIYFNSSSPDFNIDLAISVLMGNIFGVAAGKTASGKDFLQD